MRKQASKNQSSRGQPQQQFYDPNAVNYGQHPGDYYDGSANYFYSVPESTVPPNYGMQPPVNSSVMPPDYGTQGAGFNFPAQMPYLQDPMISNLAMQYGTSMVGQGSQFVQQNNWALQYDQSSQPVAPRYDVNAPDLYIPVMAFVTYLLVSGLVLGTQNLFTPEYLGIQSSTALGWLIVEILVLMFTLYILNMNTSLRYLDLIAYSSYKYVGMIFILFSGLLFQSLGYMVALAYCSLALAFFLIRTLKLQILPHSNESQFDSHPSGSKRRLYMLLVIAGIQPFVMWWLTSSVMFAKKRS